jgi:DNA-binding NarL/FixJ family response regulator
MDLHASHVAPIRVALVDGHPIARVGLRLVLEQDPQLRVVAEASTGREALRLLHETAPDVAIVDLNLSDVGGLQVTRAVKESFPRTRVLIVAAGADPEHVVGLLDAGADGLLLKSCLPDELRAGVHRIQSGERVLHQSLLCALISRATEPAHERLSPREHEVLRLTAEGATSKEIAAGLGLRPKTVENHRARILDKLGVVNTAAAVRVALARGLVSLPGAGAAPLAAPR